MSLELKTNKEDLNRESRLKIISQHKYKTKGESNKAYVPYDGISESKLQLSDNGVQLLKKNAINIPAGLQSINPDKLPSDVALLRFNTDTKTLEWAYKTFIKNKSANSFGVSCSISGDWMVVGAYGEGTNGVYAGAAYVFYNSGGTWVETQKLLASDGEEYDYFGQSCAISGNWMIVGAPYENTKGVSAGAAYVFYNSGGTWVETQKLLASDGKAGDTFGYSFSISGDWMVVGAYGEGTNGSYAGASYVFYNSGGTWVETQKLLASDGEEYYNFGWSCSIWGNWIVVGAYGEGTNGSYAGASYVFYNSGGTWVETQKLLASDGEAEDLFGYSCSISGDWMVVGAYGEDTNGSRAGASYMFYNSGGTWVETQKLMASDGGADYYFGWSCYISGDWMIVGAHGEDTKGDDSGAAYVFYNNGDTWAETQKLLASDGEEYDDFSISCSISGDWIVVGAYGEDTNGSEAGAAYVFYNSGDTWEETQKLLTLNELEWQAFI